MGVPKFYRWISERYPCLSEVIKEYQIPEFDNLYFDMNGIIHVCSHPNDEDPHFRISEEKIFADICHYIDFLFKMIKPQKVFFMAVDGVAPRAKMNQQRGRRFRTAKTAELLEQKAKASGEVLPKEARFDSNCITPGTNFMARLNEILKGFVTHKISTDKLWQNIRVYLSGHETPGEGEHKIMDFVRYEKSQNGYNPNTRHCLYGLDADLIMLGLSSHEPHFSLLREEVRFGKKENQKRIASPEEMTFHLLHLSLLREYLGHEFSPAKEAISFEFDIESVIDDFVLMSFLVGNDFIPHLPQLHIHHNALPILFKTYIDVLPDLDGYINEGGYLNLERFEIFFKKLAEYDYEKFGESSEFPPPGKKVKDEDDDEHLNAKSDDYEKLVDLGFSALTLSKTTEYDTSSEGDSDEALFELEFSQHKMDYYRSKLEYENVTSDVLQEQAEGYVRAIQWNLHYYYNGISSWSWFYPHHYAPYISDVKNFKNMTLEFEMGEPFAPFQQLLAVLPVLSKNLLPTSYQELMHNEDSPLKDCYPEDFETDLNGKQQDWEAVVLIPFINEKLLLKCALEADKKLSLEEKRRNQHGPHMLYTFTDKSSGSLESFLPGYFPPLEANTAKCQLLNKNIYRIPAEDIYKGLCSGVLLDVHFPGFPTLKHVSHTAKLSNEDVKVFQMVSQRDNMMLTITQDVSSDAEEVANSLLGQITYTTWPHLQEALVVGVATEEFTYVFDELSKVVKNQYDPALFSSQLKSVREHYHKRLGIFIGEVENPILLHAKSFIGSKLVCSNEGEITEEKQWTESITNHVLQTTVKDLSVHWTKDKFKKTFSDLFQNNSSVFMISQPLYGCMGKIIDNSINANQSGIVVEFEIPKQPDFQYIIKNKERFVSQKYKPGYEMAKSLGISGNFLARITGTVLVQTSSKESISPNNANIGLNLKFNKRNEEVSGFSKKTENNEWLYSEQVLGTLNSYMLEFPDFFERLIPHARKDVIYVEDMYPNGGGQEVVSKITKWLKSQQCSLAERQSCGLNSLDQGVVFAIENLVNKCSSTAVEKKTLSIEPKFLYSPIFCKGCVLPDPNAVFEVFDRVVNVKQNLAVPLGLRGTVIGIRTADRLCDYIIEVVLDKEFFGGLSLHCSPRRGYRMSPSALINLSYGERQLSKSMDKKVNYTNSAYLQSNMFENRLPTSFKHKSQSPCKALLTSPMQILQRGKSPQVPFYKTDGLVTPEKHHQQPSGFARLPMPPAAPNNQTTREFVVPKASQPVSSRTSFGIVKNNSVDSNSSSDFSSVWNDLMTKSNLTPTPLSSHTSNENFSKRISVEELFKPVNAKTPTKSAETSLKKSLEPKKGSMVVTLMDYCTKEFNTPPEYTYEKLALTGFYISTVKLPYGKKFVSGQCPSQEEASENAAAQALIHVKQNLQRTCVSKSTDSIKTLPIDVSYPPPNFKNFSMNIPASMPRPGSMVLPPFPPPIPQLYHQPPLPFAYNQQFAPLTTPLSRYPSVSVPAIPDSFVKQNELFLSGQIPPQEYLLSKQIHFMTPKPPKMMSQSPLEKNTKQNDNKRKVEESFSNEANYSSQQFVPLQVLKHSTKKLPENVVEDKEWPSLSKPAEKGKAVHAHVENVAEVKQLPKSFSAAVQSAFEKPKAKPKQRTRIAAVFDNMD